MIKYVFKNIKSLITKETTIFVIIIICQVSSILLSLFSYGVFQNYKAETNQINLNNDIIANDDDWPEFCYELDISEENPVDYKVMCKFGREVGNLLKDKLADLYMEGKNDVIISVEYDNGTYKPLDLYYKYAVKQKQWKSGEWFSEKQIKNKERVCVISYKLIGSKKSLVTQEGDDYYVIIGGDKYRVIGFIKDRGIEEIVLPWGLLPDDYSITCSPIISLNRYPTQKEYDSLIDIYNKYFSDRIIGEVPELETFDPEQVYYYKTNMAISLFIAIISAINFALLFNYIFDKRKFTLAVLRLNGCTANKARRMYLSEIMIIMIPLLIICTLVFDKYILPWIDGLFPYINQVYSLKIYGIMAGMYVAVSYVIMNIMIILHLRKTPVLILRNSN